MKVQKEITVALENVPGSLGHLCGCIAAKRINILGVSVVESKDMCLVQLAKSFDTDHPGSLPMMWVWN